MRNKQPLQCFVTLQKRILQSLGSYHDELETTTQDERGMNRLRVNAQFSSSVYNVYLGSFYHFHRQMISNSI